jgi:hypothetical protein
MITETTSLLLLVQSLLVDSLVVLNLFLDELSLLALHLTFFRSLTHAAFVFEHRFDSQGQCLLCVSLICLFSAK